MRSQVGSLDVGVRRTAIYTLISKENSCKTFPPMPWVLRASISPSPRNNRTFVLQEGEKHCWPWGTIHAMACIPRAAPRHGQGTAGRGERQGLGRGMLLQKSRLRIRALSQHPGPWLSVTEVPARDRLWSVVFGTGFTLRARGMNHDGYAGDFPSRTKPTPNNGGAALLVTSHGCLCVPGWSPTIMCLGWEGRVAVQPAHVGGFSSIRGQELPIFLFPSQAGWPLDGGQLEILGANIQNPRWRRHIGYPASPP